MQIGITGSAPSDKSKDPTHMLGFADVQRFFFELAEHPKRRAVIEPITEGKSFTVEDMVSAGLLRNEDGLYWLNFNFLLASDQSAIYEAAEPVGRALANAFLEHRTDFSALAAHHQQFGVDTPTLLYIALGCFSLDWGGLAFTQEKGYREGAQCALDGHEFTPWAKESGDVKLKGLYWGSHNQSATDFTFTTFGDHHSPRCGLPDVLWTHDHPAVRSKCTLDGSLDALGVLSLDGLDEIASVVCSLRSQALSLIQLGFDTGLQPKRLGLILKLLESLSYVHRQRASFGARVLVLDSTDLDMMREMLMMGQTIMASWHEQNYGHLKARLSRLTPLRHGVPFQRVYTEIWHHIFGIANRTFVEAGFFADPYAEGLRFSGYLPAIWINGLDQCIPVDAA